MPVFTLSRPFTHHMGKCFIARSPIPGDSTENGNTSILELFEDGKAILPAHTLHVEIAKGRGFSHWERQIYFASSDGSNPNENGKIYLAKLPDILNKIVDRRTTIRNSKTKLSKKLITQFLNSISEDTEYERYMLASSVSMLHPEVLAIYELAASRSSGRVVEIGAYVGGSTIALASYAKKPVIVIEAGGSNNEHPHLPTNDIIDSLRKNLRTFDLEKNVELIPISTQNPEIHDWLSYKLAGEKIGTLILDADGEIERDLRMAQPLLARDCVLIINQRTGKLAGKTLKDLTKANKVNFYGVYGDGTWIGRCKGKLDLSVIQQIPV